MICTKKIVVKNKAGIHTRPALSIVQLANSFSSLIMIEKGNVRVNGKSILGVISLGAKYDNCLIVTAEGRDSREALASIESLFDNFFGES